jgi:hypothetical protein
MSFVTKYQSVHWSAFNVFIRMFALLAMLVSLTFLAWSIVLFRDPIAAGSVQTVGISPGLLFLTGGLLSAAVGVFLLRAKPYRPDLGDSTWSLSRTSTTKADRSWWTGGQKRHQS